MLVSLCLDYLARAWRQHSVWAPTTSILSFCPAFQTWKTDAWNIWTSCTNGCWSNWVFNCKCVRTLLGAFSRVCSGAVVIITRCHQVAGSTVRHLARRPASHHRRLYPSSCMCSHNKSIDVTGRGWTCAAFNISPVIFASQCLEGLSASLSTCNPSVIQEREEHSLFLWY